MGVVDYLAGLFVFLLGSLVAACAGYAGIRVYRFCRHLWRMITRGWND